MIPTQFVLTAAHSHFWFEYVNKSAQSQSHTHSFLFFPHGKMKTSEVTGPDGGRVRSVTAYTALKACVHKNYFVKIMQFVQAK